MGLDSGREPARSTGAYERGGRSSQAIPTPRPDMPLTSFSAPRRLRVSACHPATCRRDGVVPSRFDVGHPVRQRCLT